MEDGRRGVAKVRRRGGGGGVRCTKGTVRHCTLRHGLEGHFFWSRNLDAGHGTLVWRVLHPV